MEILFTILCGLLYLVGYPFGLTYEETSIYICIYLWPILCTLSTIPIIFISLKKLFIDKKLISILFLALSTIYTTLYSYYTVLLINKYNISNPNAFTNCMLDLKVLAEYYEISYETLNILIYVVGFVFILLINRIFYKLIKNF